jgi:hypothetical protein
MERTMTHESDFRHPGSQDLAASDVSASDADRRGSAEKTPIGIIPKYIYAERVRSERIDQIIQAMYRFAKAGRSAPFEWVTELEELLSNIPEPPKCPYGHCPLLEPRP